LDQILHGLLILIFIISLFDSVIRLEFEYSRNWYYPTIDAVLLRGRQMVNNVNAALACEDDQKSESQSSDTDSSDNISEVEKLCLEPDELKYLNVCNQIMMHQFHNCLR